MKKIFLIVYAFLVFISANGQETKITFKANQLPNSKIVAGYYFADQHYVTDTIKTDAKGVGVFKRSEPLNKGIYFFVLDNKKYFDLLLGEDHEFTVSIDTADMVGKMKISGSKQNIAFNKFQQEMTPNSLEQNKLYEQLKTATETEKAGLNEKIEQVNANIDALWQKYAKEYEGTFMAKILNAMYGGKNTPDNVYGSFDMKETGLLNTPLVFSMVRAHLAQHIKKPVAIINIENDKLINAAMDNPKMYEYILNYLFNFYNTFYKVGMNEVFVYLSENYYLNNKVPWMNAKDLEAIRARTGEMKASMVGQKGHDFTMVSHLGDSINLYQTDAKYILLYFWATGCTHCDATTSELLAFNTELGTNADIAIVSVNTRDDEKAWHEYIQKKGLPWTNVWDPKNKSGYSMYYYVVSTPILYLLDQNRAILTKRIGDVEINDLLKQLLQQKERYLKK